MKVNAFIHGCSISLIVVCLFLNSPSSKAMTSLDDDELSDITGQALFVSDYVSGVGTNDGDPYNEFGFYRMGLDVELAMNANIDKLALGCGGVNDNLVVGCDIDFDYVSFMGRVGSGPGSPVTSDFKLTRPFVELAVKNDDNPTLRQIAGIKIGSQSADGFVSIGRRYQSGQINHENGGQCGSGSNALNCHSGINNLSGALGVEMSVAVPIKLNILFGAGFSGIACFGNTANTSDDCGPSEKFTTQVTGTRMTAVGLQDVDLTNNGGLFDLISSARADISQSLRFIHGFALQDTSDFGLSFQRERISYPNFDQNAYTQTANTGWWMNVPDVKVLNIQGEQVTLNLLDAISALGEGVNLTNIELNQTPAINCYGNNRFC
ncbi:hypothetical protein [Alcanivorax sp. DP30]|uniref:hypothetical protein n=1 Tax=Alcanivorax sp. DP30 TaxID=2606217 RepID=UPI00136E3B5B|nr:hypothetical protein [Alcanivorax sp. DP30]MZR61835.1 hypothetical protein [Alcanivorax sp. DP30]